ncbi:alpha/beta hydrolase family protein [Microtetraspora niveoalba]|uniref:alpha/beta hydrolase family protein n=1 Tax=Microtetraspora niveoalba TaxID=46175 RepID=UPI001C3F27E8|nr:lipase [Microtetraspora niveoalba]
MKRALIITALALTLAGCGFTPPQRLTVPKPTGPHPVGTVSVHLVDRSRPDPWNGSGRKRELMVSLWYPARDVRAHPVAPWMPKAAADRYLEMNDLEPGSLLLDRTDGHEGAPVDASLGRLPVVLYSPGANASRAYGTGVVEELASKGYAVVTVDHPYDAAVVEFPGGRVETGGELTGFAKAVDVRVADVRFVLDSLPSLEEKLPGRNGKPLFDLARIGMFGHSLGGAATSSAMYADPRIKAGLGLDGAVFGKVAQSSLDRPYMVVDTDGKGGMATNPTLRTFWDGLRGWRLNVTLKGAAHNSFGDDVLLIPMSAGPLGLSKEQLQEVVGTIPAERALAFQRAYPLAFFEQNLRGRPQALLQGPSPAFPEVSYRR